MSYYVPLDDVAYKSSQNTFTQSQSTQIVNLVDQANVNIDCTESNIFALNLGTAGANRIISASNLINGTGFTLFLYQDASGNKTVTFDSTFVFPNDDAPVLQTTPLALDIISGVSDGINIYCSYITETDFTLPANVELTDSNQTITANKTYTGTQIFPSENILFSATITTNLSTGNNKETLLTGDATWEFNNPVEGNFQHLFIQDSTGGRTLTTGTDIIIADNNSPNINPDAVNLYSCFYNAGTGKLRCSIVPFSS